MKPIISLLDDDAKMLINARTLDLLWKTGVKYENREALRALRSAGADVEEERQVAHLPPDLVEESLRRAPRTCLLAGRDPANDALLDGTKTFVSPDGAGPWTLDYRTGQRRPSTGADLAEAVRIADYLPEMAITGACVYASDGPKNLQGLTELSILLTNTAKHVLGGAQRPQDVPYVVELLEVVSSARLQKRPIFSTVYCPVSPLQHEHDSLGVALEFARLGVPILVYSLGLCGATAPVTLAGGVIQTNAEVLSAITLFQLIAPGLPVIYIADCGILDMHAGVYAAAGPEAILMGLALAEMGRFYSLPVGAKAFVTDATDVSLMTGLDAGSSGLALTLAHCDLLGSLGLLDASQVLYLPKLVLDAEVVRQCRRVAEGISFDEEHLLTELIRDVGPGGHFLSCKETSRFLRSGEHLSPRILLRGGHEGGHRGATRDIERAVAEVERILATHRPKPLPAGAESRFAEILATAASELADR